MCSVSGKKARDHFKRRDYNIIENHLDFWNDLNYDDAIQIGAGVISHFTNHHVDEIHVVYNEFVNVAMQYVESKFFCPGV